MMAATMDPFYDRKPVPKELIADVGITNLTEQEEHLNRERKYSKGGDDVRKFFNPRTNHGKDPFYERKRVPDAMITAVGVTGLTPQEEYQNRERKYSLPDGSDVRVFSNKATPQSDPFYGRRRVSKQEIAGVGETGNTAADDYVVRERKQSVVQLSDDPFKQFAGSGHRQSISAASIGAASAASERRRSSAVAPHQRLTPMHHGEKLEPIESRPEEAGSSTVGITPTHTLEYDDPDLVAPDEIR